MNIYDWLILIIWIVFMVYWAISAASAKPNIDPQKRWWTRVVSRVIAALLVIIVARIPDVQQGLQIAQAYSPRGMPVRLIGVVLCALGIGLAIWARVILGRNWGMPMSRKEQPELITTGPYGFIRHPIYTGVLAGFLGSALSTSIGFFLAFIVFGVYFVHSARQEEKLKRQEFPEQYRAYMERTKMLVPFVV